MPVDIAKIFKNAIYQDLLKYSDANSSYVASEEALRILIHFIFKDGNLSPQIISKGKIQETIAQFKQHSTLEHKQYFIEYGNRSTKTAGSPAKIHYAAMNLYRNGLQVIAVLADHYNGRNFFNFDNYSHEDTENIRVIFLGGIIYQADHNHCLIFALHHLMLSRSDNEFREIMIRCANEPSEPDFKIKMHWMKLPLVYNLDIQSASFYFKTYLDYLLEKPDGEELYQTMRSFIENNFIVVREEEQCDTAASMGPLKLLNRGICNKTIDICSMVCSQIDELEHKFALTLLAKIKDSLDEETLSILQAHYQWDNHVDYLQFVEIQCLDIEDLIIFISSQHLDSHSLRKNINLSAALMINLFLIEIAYTNNILFYNILSSALKENFSFYKKLIGFDSEKLKEFFPEPTFDFNLTCQRYKPEKKFKSNLKNFIYWAKIFIRFTPVNYHYSQSINNLFQNLIYDLDAIIKRFHPVKASESYKKLFHDLAVIIKILQSLNAHSDQQKLFIITFLSKSIETLTRQLESFTEVSFTRYSLAHSEEFAIIFVSSHPFVPYLFSNSPLVLLEKEYNKPMPQRELACATPPIKSRFSRDCNFAKVKAMFLSHIFQLSAKINLFSLKKITDFIFVTPNNSLEIAAEKLNEVFTQFSNIQLLLSYVTTGTQVVFCKEEVESILINKKGPGLRFYVINKALLENTLSLRDLDYYKKEINCSNFSLTSEYQEGDEKKIFDEYNILLRKTSKTSPQASPVSVTLFSPSPVTMIESSSKSTCLNITRGI